MFQNLTELAYLTWDKEPILTTEDSACITHVKHSIIGLNRGYSHQKLCWDVDHIACYTPSFKLIIRLFDPSYPGDHKWIVDCH